MITIKYIDNGACANCHKTALITIVINKLQIDLCPKCLTKLQCKIYDVFSAPSKKEQEQILDNAVSNMFETLRKNMQEVINDTGKK